MKQTFSTVTLLLAVALFPSARTAVGADDTTADDVKKTVNVIDSAISRTFTPESTVVINVKIAEKDRNGREKVLSTPRVTTKFEQQAVIRMTRAAQWNRQTIDYGCTIHVTPLKTRDGMILQGKVQLLDPAPQHEGRDAHGEWLRLLSEEIRFRMQSNDPMTPIKLPLIQRNGATLEISLQTTPILPAR